MIVDEGYVKVTSKDHHLTHCSHCIGKLFIIYPFERNQQI